MREGVREGVREGRRESEERKKVEGNVAIGSLMAEDKERKS